MPEPAADVIVRNLIEALERLRGDLDLEALKRALNAIRERHESLRTRFAVIEGEPVQIVEPALQRFLTGTQAGKLLVEGLLLREQRPILFAELPCAILGLRQPSESWKLGL